MLNPYTVDLSDVLVISIPNCKDLQKFIDREFKLFLLDLNRLLRAVEPIHVFMRPDVIGVRVGKRSVAESQEQNKEIMNLFHINNHRYQSLLSAGIKVIALCFSLLLA